ATQTHVEVRSLVWLRELTLVDQLLEHRPDIKQQAGDRDLGDLRERVPRRAVDDLASLVSENRFSVGLAVQHYFEGIADTAGGMSSLLFVAGEQLLEDVLDSRGLRALEILDELQRVGEMRDEDVLASELERRVPRHLRIGPDRDMGGVTADVDRDRVISEVR